MKTIPFKPREPETRTDVSVIIGWPMKRLTIDVPIDLHIRLKTGCACAVKRSPTWSGS
jgi:hypothetical protein